MSKLLDRVNNQIYDMELIAQNNPKYYKKYIKEQHELFITIKKEIEEDEKE